MNGKRIFLLVGFLIFVFVTGFAEIQEGYYLNTKGSAFLIIHNRGDNYEVTWFDSSGETNMGFSYFDLANDCWDSFQVIKLPMTYKDGKLSFSYISSWIEDRNGNREELVYTHIEIKETGINAILFDDGFRGFSLFDNRSTANNRYTYSFPPKPSDKSQPQQSQKPSLLDNIKNIIKNFF